MSINNLKEALIIEELNQLGVNDLIIKDVLKNKYQSQNGLLDLPDELLRKIIGDILQNYDIKELCRLRDCNKRLTFIIDSIQNIEISNTDIIENNIPETYITKICCKITNMTLKLDFKPRFFRAQIIFDWIIKFQNLKSLIIITWKLPSETDIFMLLLNKYKLQSLKIISGKHNLLVFHIERKNDTSLYLDDLKICTSVVHVQYIKNNYPDIQELFIENHNDDVYVYNQWSWFKGSLHVYIPEHDIETLTWMESCKEIHIYNPYAGLLDYIDKYPDKFKKNVVSYQNTHICLPMFSINLDHLVQILSNFKNIKKIILKKFRGNFYGSSFDNSINLDLIDIESNSTLFLQDLSPFVKCYKFAAPSIKINKNIFDQYNIQCNKKETLIRYKIIKK